MYLTIENKFTYACGLDGFNFNETFPFSQALEYTSVRSSVLTVYLWTSSK